jgi:NADH-quinone oxidoreductase subunit C
MNFSQTAHIAEVLSGQLGVDAGVVFVKGEKQDHLEIPATSLLPVCRFLHENSDFYFDFLNCITAVDNGPDAANLEMWYHLTSITNEISLAVKVTLPRGDTNNLPEIDSVYPIWKTADWHEREAYDLVGVRFKGHPDLRRILMPADWSGHPLRKDYQEPETYHGIKVKYE